MDQAQQDMQKQRWDPTKKAVRKMGGRLVIASLGGAITLVGTSLLRVAPGVSPSPFQAYGGFVATTLGPLIGVWGTVGLTLWTLKAGMRTLKALKPGARKKSYRKKLPSNGPQPS